MSIIRSMKIFNVDVILDHFVKSPHVPNHKQTIKTQWLPRCKFLVQGDPFRSIENWEVPMQTKVKLCTCLWRVIHQFVSNKITTIKHTWWDDFKFIIIYVDDINVGYQKIRTSWLGNFFGLIQVYIVSIWKHTIL
jgi:hypothetical protein